MEAKHIECVSLMRVIAASKRWQDVINDELERPRVKQVDANSAQGEEQSENRLQEIWPIVLKDAAVDRHVNLEIADLRFSTY